MNKAVSINVKVTLRSKVATRKTDPFVKLFQQMKKKNIRTPCGPHVC